MSVQQLLNSCYALLLLDWLRENKVKSDLFFPFCSDWKVSGLPLRPGAQNKTLRGNVSLVTDCDWALCVGSWCKWQLAPSCTTLCSAQDRRDTGSGGAGSSQHSLRMPHLSQLIHPYFTRLSLENRIIRVIKMMHMTMQLSLGIMFRKR